MFQRLSNLLARFRTDQRGVFMVFFALMAIVLVATSGAVVDFTRVQQARTRAQIALDSAALALQAKMNVAGVTAATLKDDAQLLLTERVADSSVTAVVLSATPDKPAGKLTLSGYISVPTYFVQLVGIRDIRSQILSEVTRSSSDIEVAVAADITYSMSSAVTKGKPATKLDALKDALKVTINELVKTDQSITYSKMSIVPYSNSVNVGPYTANARDPLVPGKTITNVAGTLGSIFTISGISKAKPAIVTTTANHGLAAGDFVYIGAVTGMTQITAGVYKVGTNPGNSNFKLLKASDGSDIDSSGYKTNYTANSGRVVKCQNATCKIVVTTSANHDFVNGDMVYITGAGATYFNNSAWEVSEKTNTTFVPKNVTPITANTMGNGGTAFCTKYGCQYYRFANNNSGTTIFVPTECVVERTTTTHASKDTAPSTAPVGIQYAPADGVYPGSINLEACPTSPIQPLTDSRKTLTDLVDTFVAEGSTAGHIGLAWAWYTLSPTFLSGPLGTQWPAASKPAAYKKSNLVKAIILMTDGEFNTMYHFGVPSKDADIVNTTNKSNTNAPLGTSLAQGSALCTEIKKSDYNIQLYTIGFAITANSAADTFLKNCASSAANYKTASDADTLKKAFEDIANSLSDLRLSK